VREETVDAWKERLPEILQGYAPKNICNMDETGQFFRALPNRSLAEASRNCTGGKRSKGRLTCAFFVNGSGDKEKPIIIGKSANPRCFRGISDRATLPCEYFSQPKAWMEGGILEEILRKLNARLRRENRSILLFIATSNMCFRVCHLTDDVIAHSYSGALQRPKSKGYRTELGGHTLEICQR